MRKSNYHTYLVKEGNHWEPRLSFISSVLCRQYENIKRYLCDYYNSPDFLIDEPTDYINKNVEKFIEILKKTKKLPLFSIMDGQSNIDIACIYIRKHYHKSTDEIITNGYYGIEKLRNLAEKDQIKELKKLLSKEDIQYVEELIKKTKGELDFKRGILDEILYKSVLQDIYESRVEEKDIELAKEARKKDNFRMEEFYSGCIFFLINEAWKNIERAKKSENALVKGHILDESNRPGHYFNTASWHIKEIEKFTNLFITDCFTNPNKENILEQKLKEHVLNMTRRASEKSAAKKRQIKEIGHSSWLKNGKKRTFDEANRIKIELEKQDIKRSVKTIYDWICDW